MESHLINYCSSNSTSPISEDHLQSLYEGVFQVVFPTLIVVGVLTNLLNVTVLTRPMMSNKTYR
ncbi:putative FMRFamide receptor-like 2 [Homarus americanus]|uniref:Putative FMRFamide receptor-like 2 n=2 Tax=Homarus americanus TaxID=6706 RepID=A0A8J5JQU5_HOMAM|nr:putative FMRFamide receptor-like 2 [Homarus americanus]